MLDEIVETFLSALGPFADAGVVKLARRLPVTLASRPDQLRAMMQAHWRSGLRGGPVLLLVVGDELIIEAPDRDSHAWPRAECVVTVVRQPLAGARLAVRTGEATLVLTQAMPVDEAPRVAWTVTDDLSISEATRGESRYSLHPPVARLGSAATLYDDRIGFADGQTRRLGPDVVARALELPASGNVLRSISLAVRARARPRHVLIDGPDWSQVVPAPADAPESADAFVKLVNRWAQT